MGTVLVREEQQQPEQMITRSALKRSLGSSSHVNNQQPHQLAGKIQKKNSFKDDDKKKKSKLAEGKPRKQLGNNFPRFFTPRERADYNERVKLSGGFDVGDVPKNVSIRDMDIRPLLLLDLLPNPSAIEMLKELEEYSKSALDKYNNDNETNYQFAKFLKANVRGGYNMEYYITFQAKRMAGSLPKNFQAHMRIMFKGEPKVLLCRQA